MIQLLIQPHFVLIYFSIKIFQSKIKLTSCCRITKNNKDKSSPATAVWDLKEEVSFEINIFIRFKIMAHPIGSRWFYGFRIADNSDFIGQNAEKAWECRSLNNEIFIQPVETVSDLEMVRYWRGLRLTGEGNSFG